MRKKLSYFLIATFIGLVSCTNSMDQLEDFNPQKTEVKGISTRVVSSEQAKAFAEKAIGAIQKNNDTVVVKNTKLCTVKDVKPLKSSDGKVVLYIVNFSENQGYMVLSADKEAKNPMLLFDTERQFDLEKVKDGSTVWAWLESEKIKISENLKSGIHADNQGYQLWEYIIGNDEYEVSVNIANIEEKQSYKDIQSRGTHPESSGRTSISPWYAVRYNLWGQDTGYSADAPAPNSHLAGCPAVAIGLLCRTHNYPSGYEYWDMPTSLNTTSSNAISRMFRDIANRIPGYTWGTAQTGGSGAQPTSILTALRGMGYNSAMTKPFDSWTAYSNIKDWYPILLYAYSGPFGGGHIWIADGYYEQVWKYTRTKKFLGIVISTETWYEYMDTFYMNWGWNGNGNGWIDVEDWSSGGYNYNRSMFYDLYPR